MPKKDSSSVWDQVVEYLNYLSNQPPGFVIHGEKASKETSNKQQLLKQLFAPYANCTRCPLGTLGRNTVVFGEGDPDADLMFVGEGPGREEDAQGRPFVGRAGKLLNNIIVAMHFAREDVYISNVVKCRPPNNRAPLPIESGTCKNILLLKEISIVKPKIICTLGATATQALLGPEARLSQMRGQVHELGPYLLMPTYHPAYLLRNPAAKKIVWQDMQQIMRLLAQSKQ